MGEQGRLIEEWMFTESNLVASIPSKKQFRRSSAMKRFISSMVRFFEANNFDGMIAAKSRVVNECLERS